MKILIVEDDYSVRNLIKTTLETHGYEYLIAEDGQKAILEASSHEPDVVLLDLGLPDMDGIDVIKKIRSWSNMPIIVISARTQDSDKIEALDAGADDYLTKPFSIEELLARLRVTQRRLELLKERGLLEGSSITNGGLYIDYVAETVTLDDKPLHLTPIEFKILSLLARNIGRVLTHKYLTQAIWGTYWESDIASLRVFMATLRRKIEPKGSTTRYIQTHIGVGYRMLKVDENAKE